MYIYSSNNTKISLLHWLLLPFARSYVSFDSDGRITVVVKAKYLFKTLYIVKEEMYSAETGKLMRVRKLTRRKR